MALADYYSRDAVAISQVLQGFRSDAFVDKLKGIRVAIAFGEEAATSCDGRDLLDLAVRLMARLYSSLTFVTVPAGDQFAKELMTLASSINPNIETSKDCTSDVGLAVGLDAPRLDAQTIYAGCDGWNARVGNGGPYRTSDSGNPFGAGFAASLAAANAFRFLFLPDGPASLDGDVNFPPDVAAFPDLSPATLTDPLVLVGVGAVGNSAAWALARTPLNGQLYLVDHEVVDLGNLQRYVLCMRKDEGSVKAEVAGNEFRRGLMAVPHRGTWGFLPGGEGIQVGTRDGCS